MKIHVIGKSARPVWSLARSLALDLSYQGEPFGYKYTHTPQPATKESRHDENSPPKKDDALQRRCTRS